MNQEERARFNALWERKTTGQELTQEEAEQLAGLVDSIEAAERVYLIPANERLAQEAERIEARNLRLQAVIDRREAFVTRLHSFLEEARREQKDITAELERALEAA